MIGHLGVVLEPRVCFMLRAMLPDTLLTRCWHAVDTLLIRCQHVADTGRHFRCRLPALSFRRALHPPSTPCLPPCLFAGHCSPYVRPIQLGRAAAFQRLVPPGRQRQGSHPCCAVGCGGLCLSHTHHTRHPSYSLLPWQRGRHARSRRIVGCCTIKRTRFRQHCLGIGSRENSAAGVHLIFPTVLDVHGSRLSVLQQNKNVFENIKNMQDPNG